MTSSTFPKAKRVLLKALSAHQIASVAITYDGEGDSGQIQDISAVNSKNEPVSLNRPVKLAMYEGRPPTHYCCLREAIDDFAWIMLVEYHGGFENDDGGFGRIIVNVGKRSITLDHKDRVTDVVNTTTEA